MNIECISHLYKKILGRFDAEKYFPLFLLILTFVSYGLLLPTLGYYGDDWNYAWLAYKVGSVDIFFVNNRPIIGSIFFALTKLLSYYPWQWQLLLLVMRWLISLVVFYLLQSIKILDKRIAYWISVLFLVYPGALIFYQSVTFSIGFLQLLLFLSSFWLHSLSLQKVKGASILKSLSLITAFSNLFLSEYFYFLELLRPFLVWFIYGNIKHKLRIKRVFIECMPYLAIFLFFTFYRIFYASKISGAHSPVLIGNMIIDPWSTLRSFSLTALTDTFRLGVTSWMNIIHPQQLFAQQGRITTFIYLTLAIFSFLFVFFYFSFFNARRNKEVSGARKYGVILIFIGFIALLLAGLPFWIANLKIIIGFDLENRFALPFSFGASFLVAGLLLLISNKTKANIFLFSLICAMSIGFHFLHANLFRYDWLNQKRIYWQLAWRLPTLPAPAMLISDIPPFQFEGENPLSIAINWIYFHDNQYKSQNQVGYYLYYDKGRINDEMNGLNEPLPAMHGHLFGRYSYSDYHLLTFTYRDGCLRVLDPVTAPYDPSLPDYLVKGSSISDLNDKYLEDQMHKSILDPKLFGPEPEHSWCYFFEKAELARSQGDWAQVIQIQEKALQNGFSATMPAEKIPFIEAYLGLGKWEQALNLSRTIYSADHSYNEMVCSVWGKFKNLICNNKSIIDVLDKEIECNIT